MRILFKKNSIYGTLRVSEISYFFYDNYGKIGFYETGESEGWWESTEPISTVEYNRYCSILFANGNLDLSKTNLGFIWVDEDD
ncbi:MAG: hypothetical protein J5685_02170 [Clostridiales bacterium]|nr:hypothetical protein [Clostridiales bacterium]